MGERMKMIHPILMDTDILIDAGRAVEVAITQLETTAQTLTNSVAALKNTWRRSLR